MPAPMTSNRRPIFVAGAVTAVLPRRCQSGSTAARSVDAGRWRANQSQACDSFKGMDERDGRGADGLLRHGRPDEAGRICALVNSAFRGDSSRAGGTTEAHLLDGQRADEAGIAALLAWAPEDAALLVYEEAGALVACVLLERKTAALAYLGMLTVAPTRQAGGLGHRVLAAAERHAVRAWRVEAVEMTVITARPELLAWYERRGYVQTGERRPFPMNDPRFGLPKVDHLEFAVLRKRVAPVLP